MSAFFVNEAVIDDVITLAFAHAAHWDPQIEIDPTDAGADLGRKLYAMNIEALRQRYPQIRNTEEERDYRRVMENYAWRDSSKEVTIGQLVKSASCLRYQCSEGNVPETWTLYKWLSHLIEVASENAAEGRKKVQYGEEYWDVPGEDAAKWDRARKEAA